MSDLNIPSVVAELSAVYDRYEAALVGNDVSVLQELFWNSPHAIRYGPTENLYGYTEIEAFRKSRPDVGLAREIVRNEIVTFGCDSGAVNIEFRRTIEGRVRIGRQSQFWRRLPDGWRIISAHVSMIP